MGGPWASNNINYKPLNYSWATHGAELASCGSSLGIPRDSYGRFMGQYSKPMGDLWTSTAVNLQEPRGLPMEVSWANTMISWKTAWAIAIN